MSFTDQRAFDVRCEWGREGVAALADCRAFVIVDVLSFSTCVSVATTRQVVVFPWRSGEAGAAEFAVHHQAVLAGQRGAGYSLSPASLAGAPAGMRLVVPSPNGATLSLEAAIHGRVFAGCLRNASAASAWAARLGGPVGIIPAGERWKDGSLRPAVEDLIGAGAIARMLPGKRSPEAAAAIAVFETVAGRLSDTLLSCSSGRELAERGFQEDVHLAAELDADPVSCELLDGRFGASAAQNPCKTT